LKLGKDVEKVLRLLIIAVDVAATAKARWGRMTLESIVFCAVPSLWI
jgi:hypothetical protein